MSKVSLRLDDSLLKKVDNLVDHITVKNRSQAIRDLLNDSLEEVKVAIILDKSTDLANQDINKDTLVTKKEHRLTARIEGTTIIEEQLKQLRKYGFNIVYIISTTQIMEKVKKILKRKKSVNKIHYVENNKSLRSADAMRLIAEKLPDNFLLVCSDRFFRIDLNDLFEQHIQSTATATLLLHSSPIPQLKGSTELKGKKIIDFEEKSPHPKETIVYASIFAANRRILDVEGHSFAYHMFSKLAKKGLLEGYISSGIIRQMRIPSDKKNITQFI